MDMDLDSHEVQPQYQDHVDIVPLYLNLKHKTKYHHQMEMEECLYLILIWIVVDQATNLLQTKQCTL